MPIMMSDVEIVEEFLHENYRLRFNILSEEIEMDGKSMTLQDENSLILEARKKIGDVDNLKTLLNEVLHSNSIPQYNPIEDYLSHLPLWDGKDHVGDLLDRVPGMTEEVKGWMRTWLRGVVNQWKSTTEVLHGNECVPTLISPHQGAHKSTFFKLLLPVELQKYYLDNLNLSNGFSKEMALTNNLLVNLDEMDQIKASQQAELKYTISRPVVNGRPIFGRKQKVRKRFASFVATTNNLHPLQDATGSRRFICVQIPRGQYIDVDTPVNYGQLYAQITNEIDVQHQTGWFTNEEVAAIELHNSQYMMSANLQLLIESHYRLPQDGETASAVPLKNIVAEITNLYPNMFREKNLDVKIALLLKKLGFTRKRTMVGSVYNVVSKGS